MESETPINEILCGRNEAVLATLPSACIDLTVTSPPYDDLRAYKGFTWDFDATAHELWRVTKPGGVVVWVVADATVDGSETGTSFRQALAFMALGFRMHDTMIYHRESDPPKPATRRYKNGFEYMFVLSKGKVGTFNPLLKQNAKAGHGEIKSFNTTSGIIANESMRYNVWKYETGGAHSTLDRWAYEHGAPFPEKLAEDHILSWSNPGDLVLDPFVGSGTTPKMAIKHHRRFIGIDISAEYCDLARRRIGTVQETLFALEAHAHA